MWKLTIYQYKYFSFEPADKYEVEVVFLSKNLNEILSIVNKLEEMSVENKTWYRIDKLPDEELNESDSN